MFVKEDKYFIFDQPENRNYKYYIKKLITLGKNAWYRVLLTLSRSYPSENKKYKVSICAIFKNEAPYIREWIEYHKIVGVEHFYMYNNFSDDNYMDILKPYIECGDVTLIQWEVPQGQIPAYRDCVKKFSKETNWIGFIDLDEYIVPNKDDSVGAFLDKFKKYPSVLIYWRMFCSSGLMERDISGLVTEDFTVCWEKYDTVGKCFYNTSFNLNIESKHNTHLHHILWGSFKGLDIPPVNVFGKIALPFRNKAKSDEFPIQINHYFTKSYEEYVQKRNKGDVYFKINPHDEKYFYRHEMLCKSTDYHIYKYLIKLKRKLYTDIQEEPDEAR